jgi:hypothetical protein
VASISRKHRAGAGVRITPEMVELWRWQQSILDSGQDEVWEEQGGRQREWHNVTSALHSLLNLELWDSTVHSCDGDPRVEPLRRALVEAAEAQERQGRPLMRPIADGLQESEEANKRATAFWVSQRPRVG